MDKLVTVADVADRYGCSRQTARKYIRECKPHLEKPLAVTEQAFREWEAVRTVGRPVTTRSVNRTETVHVPRRR